MTGSFFGMGIWHPKREVNVGGLWRSAHVMGASYIFTVGRRYSHQASDTSKARLVIPLFHFDTIEQVVAHLPYSTPLIGIELVDDAVPIHKFDHPTRAAYLLGAEDHGLTPVVLDRCHKIIRIETPHVWSMNVATTGGIVLYDRYIKSRHRIQESS